MAPTPDGGGYWLVAADGGVFAYGDAAFDGSAGGIRLAAPVVGIAARPGRIRLLAGRPRTAACSPTATPPSTVRSAAWHWPLRSPASRSTADGGGYWLDRRRAVRVFNAGRRRLLR